MKIAVIGAGYVGLVSSACLAELGHSVTLIEIDNDKVQNINLGIPPIYEKGLDGLLLANVGKNLVATSDNSAISDSDISLICVGTPPGKDGEADLSWVVSASQAIGQSLRSHNGYHVVAVKSTVPPGTTEQFVIPNVLKYSDKSYHEIGFVMNPEFLREGLAVKDFMNPDRIVIGSLDKKSGDIFGTIYKDLKSPSIRTSLKAAEMIKYTSNAFLATKISFSNEIGNICKRLDIDVYEVMQGVGLDHRINPHFLNAGVGFGGSCFPKDVSALIHLAEDIGENPILLKSVIDVNNLQPLRIIKLLEKRLGKLEGKRIAMLGLAFKNDTDDARESRAIPIINELKRRGANVAGYDPKANSSMKSIIPDIEYCESARAALKKADGCLVVTEWPVFGELSDEFDSMSSKVIIEGRRVLNCKDAEGLCW
jgi:UDPglucose 6-dehydrogenase